MRSPIKQPITSLAVAMGTAPRIMTTSIVSAFPSDNYIVFVNNRVFHYHTGICACILPLTDKGFLSLPVIASIVPLVRVNSYSALYMHCQGSDRLSECHFGP